MKIDLVVFDIDGVLTDGKIYIDAFGNETKRFSLTEIDAINDIIRMGIHVAAITGENTPIVDVFEKKVQWSIFVRGCKNKLEALREMEETLGILNSNVCYIGDGKYDIEPIRYAGFGVCPNNAIQDVKDVADVVLKGRGGESCVYELLKCFVAFRTTDN